MQSLKPTLGDYVAKKRHAKGWSQRALADLCGFSYVAIQKIENNTTKNPGVNVLKALSTTLEAPLEDLIKASDGLDPEKQMPKSRLEAIKKLLNQMELTEIKEVSDFLHDFVWESCLKAERQR
jgi:transcriptional regulator with XRE-family HTH domain